jgi:hypothetical protein
MDDEARTVISPSTVRVGRERVMRIKLNAQEAPLPATATPTPSATPAYAMSLSGGFGGWRKPG